MTEFSFPSEEYEEQEESISFFTEDIEFQLQSPKLIQEWISKIILREKHQLSYLNFIFCSDNYLLKINQEYLDHDTYTDIITFPYNSSPIIESDIYISIDRVKENSKIFKSSFLKELNRVIIHGVLHLCGYGDKNTDEKEIMRNKENEALEIFSQLKK